MIKRLNALPLIIGIAIPVLMVLFVAGSIYLPHLFTAGPKYDILYAAYREPSNPSQYYGGYNFPQYYDVTDGRIKKKEFPAYVSPSEINTQAIPQTNPLFFNLFNQLKAAGNSQNGDQSRAIYESQKQAFLTAQSHFEFYVHNVKANQNRRVFFDEVQQMRVDNSAVSEDGFQFVQGGGGGEFFFPFGIGGNSDARYVVKGNNGYVKRLNLPVAFTTVTFVGWIVK